MSGSDGAVNDEISVRKAVKPAVSFWVLFQQPQISRIVLATILPEFALIVYSTTAFAMFGIEILGVRETYSEKCSWAGRVVARSCSREDFPLP